jgi:hypothetical protein
MVRFQVVMVMSTKTTVFWDVVPCSQAVSAFETLVSFYMTVWRNVPEDCCLQDGDFWNYSLKYLVCNRDSVILYKESVLHIESFCGCLIGSDMISDEQTKKYMYNFS